MSSFTPKPCWDFNSKSLFSATLEILQPGSEDNNIVRIEQRFSVEKIDSKDGYSAIQILSDPIHCNDQKYMLDTMNKLNLRQLGLNMIIQIDSEGELNNVLNIDEILMDLETVMEPANNIFWNTYKKASIQSNPYLFIKGIYDKHYGLIFKNINKIYELPYTSSKETVLKGQGYQGETRILATEKIVSDQDRMLLNIEVENTTDSIEIKGEYNTMYKTGEVKSLFESQRVYMLSGQLVDYRSKLTQNIISSTTFHHKKPFLENRPVHYERMLKITQFLHH